jgi:hypothetical protein
MKWLARLYARRIINVNVNIVLAGLLALPPVILTVYLVQHFGLAHTHTINLGPFSFYTISAITLVSDLIFDFGIYMGLHWLANHHPWRSRFLDKAEILLDKAEHLLEPAHRGLSFIHDAGLVQFERAVLSPLLYGVWIGLQSFLIKRGMGAEAATALGCIAGIAMARTLHTLWMLRQERRARAALRRMLDERGASAPASESAERPNGTVSPRPAESPSSADQASRMARAGRP